MKRTDKIIMIILASIFALLVMLIPNLSNTNCYAETEENQFIDEDNRSISECELVIKGISLYDSLDRILKVLGEPLEKERETCPDRHDDSGLLYFDTWVYNNFDLVFISYREDGKPAPEKPDRLYLISTSNQQYITKHGIKVGDSVEKLIEAYGSAEPQGDIYVYELDEEGYESIQFKIESGKVKRITYVNEPD